MRGDDAQASLTLSNAALRVRRSSVGEGRGVYAAYPLDATTVLLDEVPLQAPSKIELAAKLAEDPALLSRYSHLCRPTAKQDWAQPREDLRPREGSRGISEGIVRSNGFVAAPGAGGKSALLLRELSLVNHSCCPNASVAAVGGSVGDGSDAERVRLVAAVDVPEGAELTFCYAEDVLFSERARRQEILLQRFGFTCCCPRCGEGGASSLSEEEAMRWRVLEEAAAAAEAAKPKRAQVEPEVASLQRDALAALNVMRPALLERRRFEFDLQYFAGKDGGVSAEQQQKEEETDDEDGEPLLEPFLPQLVAKAAGCRLVAKAAGSADLPADVFDPAANTDATAPPIPAAFSGVVASLPPCVHRLLVDNDPPGEVAVDELLTALERKSSAARKAASEGGVLHRPGVLSPKACAALRRAVDAEQSMLADTVDRAPEHQLSFGRGAEAREAVERLLGHDEAARLWALPLGYRRWRRGGGGESVAACAGEEEVSAQEAEKEVANLQEAFVRRYCPQTRPILKFHADAYELTINVALSADAAHGGGRLIGCYSGRVRALERSEGDATVHSSSLLHAVSRMTYGVRYSLVLFFDRQPDRYDPSRYEKRWRAPKGRGGAASSARWWEE
jgi:predicted 2-oxoglutarate/Fe(II)-dependent dioxygenase YbiX